MKVVVIETGKGNIVCRVHEDGGVDNTIKNFEDKANAGFFNGLVFHRVEHWVIQGGDPTGTGSGGNKITAEYNRLPFSTGALGVARGPDRTKNSDCQFFIVKSDSDFLNGDYTNWGHVIEGMDVVNRIAIGDRMSAVRFEEREVTP